MRQREGKLIRYAISTSEFISDIQEECLHIGRGKHVVTGYPRNDILFNLPEEALNKWRQFIDKRMPKKVALYGPSWRHGRETTKFFPFSDFNKRKLIEFLEATDTFLLLRPHVNDLRDLGLVKFLEPLVNSSQMVMFATHEQFQDVNSIIPFVDILISDYSALYHDFLILDRPLIFVPYDYEDFEKQNGFLYDYYRNLPGPAVETFNQFINHLQKVINGEDEFKKQRHLLRDKIHSFQDGKSCERVTVLIDDLLRENY